MIQLALVSVLAAPVPAADAPAPGPVEPAPVDVAAPAPAPAEAPPAAAEVTTPAPAPTEAAPATPIEAPAPTTAREVMIVEVERPISESRTTTDLMIVPVPERPPAPIVSPPAPTWGPVRPTPPAPLDPARVQQTIRSHRQGAAAAFAIGGLGMTAALGMQYVRARSLQRCVNDDSIHSPACDEAEDMNVAFGFYSAMGMGMFVAGTAGAGVMLGNAAATRDVQLRGGSVRRRAGLKLLGVATIGAASAWLIGANLQLLRLEGQCDDPQCLARYRPLRWAANDGAALGIAAGAGMLGYAVAYERQGKALMALRAAPSLSATQAGVAVAMEF